MDDQLKANLEGFEPRPCPFCAKLYLHYEFFEYVDQDFIGFRMICDGCSARGPLVKIILSICLWQPNTQDFVDHGALMALEAWNERQLTDTIGESLTICPDAATA